jgi:hypothetical protein
MSSIFLGETFNVCTFCLPDYLSVYQSHNILWTLLLQYGLLVKLEALLSASLPFVDIHVVLVYTGSKKGGWCKVACEHFCFVYPLDFVQCVNVNEHIFILTWEEDLITVNLTGDGKFKITYEHFSSCLAYFSANFTGTCNLLLIQS